MISETVVEAIENQPTSTNTDQPAAAESTAPVPDNGEQGGDVEMPDDNQVDQEAKPDETKVPIEEINTGIKFPGPSLEAMLTFKMDDIELSSRDIMVIEIIDSETNEFVFSYKEVIILGYGKCEYCYSYKPLTCECACKDVQYCTEECLKKDLKFHLEKCKKAYQIDKDFKVSKKDKARMGLTGLQNLGNTCFMNSSIQCLSNTKFLTQYFTEERFRNELNEDNNLGTGGQLVLQYAHLLISMWFEESPSVSPWSFKKVVGEFQPMFSGFAQHDSAELLSYVLDGLHEDLNCVKTKPYLEMPDFRHFNELQRAQYSWKYHLMRNQSVIVDLMHGQYKSTLVCPKCNNISITYDPFMMLSLPIPMNETHFDKYYYVPYDRKDVPKRSQYMLKKKESVHELRKQIAEQMGVDEWSFVLAIVDDDDMQKMICRNKSVGDICEDKGVLFAYQLPTDVLPDAGVIAKLKEGGADGHINMSIDDDFNNGLGRNWIKVPLPFVRLQKSKYSFYERKSNMTFPKMIWLNLDWSLERVHLEIFKFLRFYFDYHEEIVNLSDEEAYKVAFEGLTLENMSEFFGSGEHEGDAPYTIQMVNPEKRSFYSDSCKFCGDKKCINCPLELSNEKTLRDTVNLFFKKDKKKKKGWGHNNYSGGYSIMGNGSSDEEDEEKKQSPEEIEALLKNDGIYHENPDYYKKNKLFVLEIFWNRHQKHANLDKVGQCYKFEGLEALEEKSRNNNDEAVHLKNCFEANSQSEKLSADNSWYCRMCKDHVEALKQIEIYKAPPVMFINLKRFKSSAGSYYKDKLEDTVNFPLEELDLSDNILSNKNEYGTNKETIIYELYAVSNHYGNMGFGHYTAFAKNHKTGLWYDFDDSRVSQVDPDSVITDAAYNLFYQRKDFYADQEISFESIRNLVNTEEFKEEMDEIRRAEDEEDKIHKQSQSPKTTPKQDDLPAPFGADPASPAKHEDPPAPVEIGHETYQMNDEENAMMPSEFGYTNIEIDNDDTSSEAED